MRRCLQRWQIPSSVFKFNCGQHFAATEARTHDGIAKRLLATALSPTPQDDLYFAL